MNHVTGLLVSAMLLLGCGTNSTWAAEPEGEFFYGDMNCDGELNFGDINPFVLALTNPAGYAMTYPACDIGYADINGDGRADFGDINPFVSLLADPQPYVRTQSNTDCLPRTMGGWCEPDEFVFVVEGHTLRVLHKNIAYNCCLDKIVVHFEIQGSTLRFDEEEILTLPCYCVCCFEAETTVANLPSGTYEVVYCWYEYSTHQVECYETEIVIP